MRVKATTALCHKCLDIEWLQFNYVQYLKVMWDLNIDPFFGGAWLNKCTPFLFCLKKCTVRLRWRRRRCCCWYAHDEKNIKHLRCLELRKTKRVYTFWSCDAVLLLFFFTCVCVLRYTIIYFSFLTLEYRLLCWPKPGKMPVLIGR